MSSDNSFTNNNNNPNDMNRQHQRRDSLVTSAALSNLFRSNSISQPPVTGFPGPTTATGLDTRRRLSISTFGLSGTSPTAPSSFLRRASLSTNESADENAIDDDEAARTAPNTPFTRRMSFGGSQAMRGGIRAGLSPGTNGRQSQPLRRRSTVGYAGGPPTPPLSSAGAGSNYSWGKTSAFPQPGTAYQIRATSDLCSPRSDQGFNWSEQLRSRAESTVAQGARPSFSFASGLSASPPRGVPPTAAAASVSPRHDRANSVSDMPAPPAQQPSRARVPQKPDPFQERILKGDFYMD
ncbi:hypothetical protein QBC42DRAFT_30854 [Cladorrhinum samala]|uniref:Uncharacterized protein n=1 Tax=Cladorrhinum samala TaxID=585594 RepID=A0AAV9HEN1_9PEZI|nr:hypothetical protein QBC42DRAFT_30854 [Cladorrhinum samala]